MIRKFLVVAGVVLFASCSKEETTDKGNENLPIILSATFANEADGSAQTGTAIKAASSSQSRATATAFEGGDELGLFVVKSGMEVQREGNLVNNHKMVVGDDGVIKGTPTAVYYPTQSVSLYSYYPYQSGDATADALGVLVGIRTDQTDFSSVKRSDLCFGSAHDIAPSKAAQPLSFKHSFAQVRVNVTLFTGCPSIKQLRLINIKDSATLNIQTGALTLKSHTAEVLTYPNSAASPTSFTAIIPAQTLAGACVAIDLTDNNTTYIYNAVTPINLAQSATNTLNLTVNEKGVITLNGEPTISAWGDNTNSGNLSESVNNQISLYWLAPHADYATADKIVLNVVDLSNVAREIEAALTLDPKSSTEYAVYTFPFVISGAGYPMIITQAKIYKGATLLRQSPQAAILGKTITKSGEHTIGLNLYIYPSETSWENVDWKGSTKTITVSTVGTNDWTATVSGAGLSITPTSGTSGQDITLNWTENSNGKLSTTTRSATITFATNPNGGTSTFTTTQAGVTPTPNSVRIDGLWWSTINVGASAPQGYGSYYYFADNPCPSGWRTPTTAEWQELINSGYSGWTSYNGSNGRWFGPTPGNENTSIFIPAAGRRIQNGSYNLQGTNAYYWTANGINSTHAYSFSMHNSGELTAYGSDQRDTRFPVRCVSN